MEVSILDKHILFARSEQVVGVAGTARVDGVPFVVQKVVGALARHRSVIKLCEKTLKKL
jgi:hypothetical protein